MDNIINELPISKERLVLLLACEFTQVIFNLKNFEKLESFNAILEDFFLNFENIKPTIKENVLFFSPVRCDFISIVNCLCENNRSLVYYENLIEFCGITYLNIVEHNSRRKSEEETLIDNITLDNLKSVGVILSNDDNTALKEYFDWLVEKNNLSLN